MKRKTKTRSTLPPDKWQRFLSKPNFPIGAISSAEGMTGARKTWLHLYESLQLSRGNNFRGNPTRKKCRVLYLHNDLTATGFRERLLSLGINPEKRNSNLVALHKDILDDTCSKEEIHGDLDDFCLDLDFTAATRKNPSSLGNKYRIFFENLISKHKPDLIVIDPLFGFAMKLSNSNVAPMLINYLKKIAKRNSVHIRIIMNHGKEHSTAKSKSSVMGSSYFSNVVQVRESILLKDGETEWVYVHRIKDNYRQKDLSPDFKYRLVQKRGATGNPLVKTDTRLKRRKGRLISVKRKFPVFEVEYSKEFDFEPEQEPSRRDEITEALLEALKDVPAGLLVTQAYDQTRKTVKCAKTTFTACKDALVKRGKIIETDLGDKNKKLLTLKEAKG